MNGGVNLKKFFLSIMLVTFLFFINGCTNKEEKSFQFTTDKVSLEVNNVLELPFTIKGYSLSDLTFDIADEEIAIVDGNYLSSMEIGTTKLTVKDSSGKILDELDIEVTGVLPKLKMSRNLLEVGQQVAIKVVDGKDASEYIWTIGDDSIISLDEKYVAMALKPGITTITIEDKSNHNIKVSEQIEVIPVIPRLTSPTSLFKIDTEQQLQLLSEEGFVLTDFTITIDNEEVISINNDYVIKALKVGKATITIVFKDNNKVTTSYEVEVVDPNIEVDDEGEPTSGPLILLPENQEATVKAGEEIEIEIYGAKDNYNYRWRIDDPSIVAATDEGKIMGCKEGRTLLTVVSKKDNKIKGQIEITVIGTPNVDYPTRMVEVAKRELGYVSGSNQNNKYGDWFEYNNIDWCAIFVSWVANQSGVGVDVVHKFSLVSDGVKWFKKQGRYYDQGSYVPQPGDIIFFQRSGNPSHTGVVISCDGTKVYTVEGNTGGGDGKVSSYSYTLTDTYVLGYGHPNYPPYTE